jgi:siroheme synthase-like protein
MLRIAGKRCVVVGGGEVAAQKVRQLLECGADILIVSPALNDELQTLARQGRICWLPQPYDPAALNGAFLVFACTDDNEVNRRVFADCQARQIWCNVVDVPELCSFFMPSILRRGDLVIAVSTSGNSPAFARQVRLFLEGIVGDEFGRLVALLGELKDAMRQTLPTFEQRRKFIERVWQSEIWAHLQESDGDAARQCLRQCLTAVAQRDARDGETQGCEG